MVASSKPLMLLFASAGVFHHAGIKIPYFGFFGHDSGIRVREARSNMLIAMAAMAALCIGIGVFPGTFYRILPYPVEYEPYTATHVITSYQLLLYSALAFTFLKVTHIYPPELRSTNLDFDWTYRRVLPAGVSWAGRMITLLRDGLGELARGFGGAVYRQVYRLHGPEGVFARTWTTGAVALCAVLALWGFLLLYFWER